MKTKALKQLAAGDHVTFTGEADTRTLIVTKVKPTLVYCGVHKFDRETGRAVDQPGFIVPDGAPAPAKLPPPVVGLAAAVKRRIEELTQEDFERLGEERLRQLADLVGANLTTKRRK